MKYRDDTGLPTVQFWRLWLFLFVNFHCKAEEEDEDDYYYDVWEEDYDYSAEDTYDDQQKKRPVTRIDYKK